MFRIINTLSDSVVIEDVTVVSGPNTLSVGAFVSVSNDPVFINHIIENNFKIYTGSKTLTGQDSIDYVINVNKMLGVNINSAKRGITEVRKSGSTSTELTNAAIWTPASGKRFVVTDFIVSVHNNTTLTAHTLQVFDGTNSNGNHLINDVNAPGANYVIRSDLKIPFTSAATNNVLRATTSGAIRVGYVLRGFEIF